MYRNRLPNDIVLYWQDDVEQNIEAGASPVLELGVSNVFADDIPAILATQRWSAERTDVARPLFPAGGLGPLWMAVLLRPLPRYSLPDAPEPVVLYSGANDAEYLLTVALVHADSQGAAPGGPQRSTIPISCFVPQSQPAMALSWDALPFLSLGPMPREPRASRATDETVSTPPASADPTQDWLAWAGLLLALFLVLLAVLL